MKNKMLLTGRKCLKKVLITALLVGFWGTISVAAAYSHIPVGTYDFQSPETVLNMKEEFMGPFFGPVKRVVLAEGEMAEFYRSGVIALREIRDNRGEVIRSVRFDEKGREVEAVVTETRGTSTFTYDELWKKVFFNVCYDKQGLNCVLLEGETDSKGRIVSIVSGASRKMTYNEAGQVIFMEYYWYQGHRREYSYDQSGRMTKKMAYKAKTRSKTENPTLVETREFFYDAAGRLIRIEVDTGKNSEVFDVDGVYDTYNNWTELELKSRRNMENHIIRRTIEYYSNGY